MTLETLSAVHASHDLQRGRHTLVEHGSPGKVVDSHQNWGATTYTVEFESIPFQAPGSNTVTLNGLTTGDVDAD
jgi:hypothetical protein